MASKKKAARRTRASDFTVWNFCRGAERLYVRRNMPLKTFLKATQAVLSFNKGSIPDHARRTEIEIFAKRLHFYMQSVDYEPKAGARAKVRASVKNADNPIKDLLDVVAAVYKRRRR